MRILLLFLAILALCVPAVGQPIVLDLDDGIYVLNVDGATVTVERARVPGVTPKPPIDDPVPPGDDDPDPIDLTALVTVSAAEYAKIPDGVSKQIGGLTVATVYRKIAEDLRSGSANVAQAAGSIQQVRDALPSEWNGWKTETAKTWNTLQDQGLITSPATWADAAEKLADGIAPAEALAAYEIDEDEFLDNPFVGQMVKMLLELLGNTDGPLAKWLPIILALLPIIFGGL